MCSKSGSLRNNDRAAGVAVGASSETGSLQEAIGGMKSNLAILHDLMAKLSESDQARAWEQVEQGMNQFVGRTDSMRRVKFSLGSARNKTTY